MAVKAIDVTTIGIVPNNDDWNGCRLRRPYTEVAYASNDVEHTLANERIRHQPLHLLLREIGLFEHPFDQWLSEQKCG